jgi:CheY-like chemotaxis protein
VLVVDQDPAASEQVTKRLQRAGVRVLRASTGMQGYLLAISKAPDAVVTELGVPNGGGADMLECLKDTPETQHIPVIVHTAQNYPGMRNHLKRLGASAVVDKADHRAGDLLELVERLLAGQQAAAGRSATTRIAG